MELAGEVDERIEEHRKLSYERWARKMEQLRWEFEVCAGRISDSAKNLAIQVRRYDLIDQSQWENIITGLGAARTWFFSVDFNLKGKWRRYFFFFGKHYWSDLDNEQERENRACLLISEDDSSGEATRLDELDNCPISLREIFVVDNALVRKRVEQSTGELAYNRDVAPLDVAKDFIRDVLLRRMT